MGEIFMQNHGTLFHSSQFKPDVLQHKPVFFFYFHTPVVVFLR